MVKWPFLIGLKGTTLENCGKKGIVDRTGPDYGGLFSAMWSTFVVQSSTGVVLCSTGVALCSME